VDTLCSRPAVRRGTGRGRVRGKEAEQHLERVIGGGALSPGHQKVCQDRRDDEGAWRAYGGSTALVRRGRAAAAGLSQYKDQGLGEIVKTEIAVRIPRRFFRVRYDGRRGPGSAGVRCLGAGANCQRFAYEMLRHYGREIRDFRSSELWADTRITRRVTRLRPLDLLLFNRTRRAWGAHVAVYLGSGMAIHLCKAVGRPAVWSLDEFAACARYRVFLGAKRARRLSNRMRAHAQVSPA